VSEVELSASELAPSLKPALKRARVCESIERMELGVHLPLMEFGNEGQSLGRLQATVDAAGRSGFVAVSANDHFVFSTPWLDGLTALAAVIDRTGEMTLATTISLAALRGPVPLAKALAALDVLSDGRLVAGVGPGSSERDYDAFGIPFEDRWKRFEEAVRILRALLRQERAPQETRYFAAPDLALAPAPRQSGGVPLWIGSWGSAAGLRRVARLGDGWLASAYNTTPEQFVSASALLSDELRRQGRRAEQFPNALVTMWTWITESRVERERVLADVLAPLLKRDVDELRDRVCVGSARQCAELLSRYAAAGCQLVYLWPLGDEPRQIELAGAEVAPRIDP
jgi:alkanesulfonate monooxygenase SsuD/methylene tetrahydromethanopterin reductase-like flavin-dependent oxidoreductase (luciferase family)